MNSEKNIVSFISRQAPYGRNSAQLCLDMALAFSVFEQEVKYIFLDDGVYQLRANQDGAAIHRKTLGNALETLQLYGIEDVLVDAESLRVRGLETEQLLMPVTVITRDEVRQIISNSDSVFNL